MRKGKCAKNSLHYRNFRKVLSCKSVAVVIFEGVMEKASKRNRLLAKNLPNEADGTRTHNLRIDSPML